jgi:hypothetical protein
MTPLTRLAGLLIALSLLTSAATAYAECAWVLWQNVTVAGKESRGWQSLSGFENNRGCQEAMWRHHNGVLATHDNKGLDLLETGDVLALMTGESNSIFGWRCLPDTVDPRGTKR